MARTLAELPAGSRITDYISLGVIARFFPVEKIHEVLEETKRASVRERDLPAHIVIYYVIALALYMRSSYREVLRCLLEGVQWLLDPSAQVKVAGKSGISQARSRLGAEPVKKLYDAVVAPIAEKRTKGAWYRHWRLASLDGSTLDVADTAENEQAFGRPGARECYAWRTGSSPLLNCGVRPRRGERICFGARAIMLVWRWKSGCQTALTSAGFTRALRTGGIGETGLSYGSLITGSRMSPGLPRYTG